MIVRPAAVLGAYVIDPEPAHDERGLFARLFCAEEFAAYGLDPCVAQASVSVNNRRGTLRGLHWQAGPPDEVKVVRCVRGAAWDVVADVRPGSATFGRWSAVELREGSHRAVYIPGGVAHGFLTLSDTTELSYQMSAPYVAGAARGVRWDDPRLAIDWPFPPVIISERDRALPGLADLFTLVSAAVGRQ